MSLPTAGSKGTIVAAVALDGRTRFAVEAAAALARRFDMSLRLVHAVQEEPMDPWAFEVPAYVYNLPMPYDSLEARAADAQARLETYAAGTGLGSRVRGEVVAGEPAAAVESYCRIHRANLLVTAFAPDESLVDDFFSTTLALMASAPLPILVVGPGRVPPFEREGFAVLLADDLTPHSAQAARAAFELAARYPAGRIRQVHVRGRLPAASDAASRERDREARRKRLCERGEPFRARIAAERPVEVEIRDGGVAAELAAAAADFQPDLLVFGRHKALHTRPLLLGKVPFKQMTAGPCAVLVVPPVEELRSPLPFPARP